MTSIVDYARLSDAVYQDDPQAAGWIRTAFCPSQSGLSHAFQGACFSRSGESVFAFKGTSQGRDVVADLKLGVGMNSSQFSDAGDFVQSIGVTPDTVVTVCGHSLGGAIAQIVGNRLRARFVTFNAPGVAVLSTRNWGEMAVAMSTQTFLLRIGGMVASTFMHPFQAAEDVRGAFYRVSGVNFRLGADVVGNWGVHYGQVIQIPYSGGAFDVVARHSIVTFIAELERLGYDNITLANVLD